MNRKSLPLSKSQPIEMAGSSWRKPDRQKASSDGVVPSRNLTYCGNQGMFPMSPPVETKSNAFLRGARDESSSDDEIKMLNSSSDDDLKIMSYDGDFDDDFFNVLSLKRNGQKK